MRPGVDLGSMLTYMPVPPSCAPRSTKSEQTGRSLARATAEEWAEEGAAPNLQTWCLIPVLLVICMFSMGGRSLNSPSEDVNLYSF